jgi:hypothetical protein
MRIDNILPIKKIILGGGGDEIVVALNFFNCRSSIFIGAMKKSIEQKA